MINNLSSKPSPATVYPGIVPGPSESSSSQSVEQPSPKLSATTSTPMTQPGGVNIEHINPLDASGGQLPEETHQSADAASSSKAGYVAPEFGSNRTWAEFFQKLDFDFDASESGNESDEDEINTSHRQHHTDKQNPSAQTPKPSNPSSVFRPAPQKSEAAPFAFPFQPQSERSGPEARTQALTTQVKHPLRDMITALKNINSEYPKQIRESQHLKVPGGSVLAGFYTARLHGYLPSLTALRRIHNMQQASHQAIDSIQALTNAPISMSAIKTQMQRLSEQLTTWAEKSTLFLDEQLMQKWTLASDLKLGIGSPNLARSPCEREKFPQNYHAIAHSLFAIDSYLSLDLEQTSRNQPYFYRERNSLPGCPGYFAFHNGLNCFKGTVLTQTPIGILSKHLFEHSDQLRWAESNIHRSNWYATYSLDEDPSIPDPEKRKADVEVHRQMQQWWRPQAAEYEAQQRRDIAAIQATQQEFPQWLQKQIDKPAQSPEEHMQRLIANQIRQMTTPDIEASPALTAIAQSRGMIDLIGVANPGRTTNSDFYSMGRLPNYLIYEIVGGFYASMQEELLNKLADALQVAAKDQPVLTDQALSQTIHTAGQTLSEQFQRQTQLFDLAFKNLTLAPESVETFYNPAKTFWQERLDGAPVQVHAEVGEYTKEKTITTETTLPNEAAEKHFLLAAGFHQRRVDSAEALDSAVQTTIKEMNEMIPQFFESDACRQLARSNWIGSMIRGESGFYTQEQRDDQINRKDFTRTFTCEPGLTGGTAKPLHATVRQLPEQEKVVTKDLDFHDFRTDIHYDYSDLLQWPSHIPTVNTAKDISTPKLKRDIPPVQNPVIQAMLESLPPIAEMTDQHPIVQYAKEVKDYIERNDKRLFENECALNGWQSRYDRANNIGKALLNMQKPKLQSVADLGPAPVRLTPDYIREHWGVHPASPIQTAQSQPRQATHIEPIVEQPVDVSPVVAIPTNPSPPVSAPPAPAPTPSPSAIPSAASMSPAPRMPQHESMRSEKKNLGQNSPKSETPPDISHSIPQSAQTQHQPTLVPGPVANNQASIGQSIPLNSPEIKNLIDAASRTAAHALQNDISRPDKGHWLTSLMKLPAVSSHLAKIAEVAVRNIAIRVGTFYGASKESKPMHQAAEWMGRLANIAVYIGAMIALHAPSLGVTTFLEIPHLIINRPREIRTFNKTYDAVTERCRIALHTASNDGSVLTLKKAREITQSIAQRAIDDNIGHAKRGLLEPVKVFGQRQGYFS